MNKWTELIPVEEDSPIPSALEFRDMTTVQAQQKLKEQFVGKPYVTYELARLLVPLRRWPDKVDDDYSFYDYQTDCKEFISLLSEYVDTVVDAYLIKPTTGSHSEILKHYEDHAQKGMRWIASYLDTLVDIHPNITIRNQALTVMLITKFMPPYFYCPSITHKSNCWNTYSTEGVGTDWFVGDTWQNMKDRIEKTLEITWDQDKDPKNVVRRLYNCAIRIVDEYHQIKYYGTL